MCIVLSYKLQICKKIILLDSDLSESVFCNKNYVRKIRESWKKINIGSNIGTMISTMHWFNEDSITNIISLADMVTYFRVTFDSENQLVFVSLMPNKLIKWIINYTPWITKTIKVLFTYIKIINMWTLLKKITHF